jgi:phage regulator Rha-like protein
MNNLVQILDNKVTTTSLQVADHFNKRHSTILRTIDEIIKNNDFITEHNFVLCYYEAEKTRNQ